MPQVERFFRQSRTEWNVFNLFRLCVERMKSYEKTRSTLLPTATVSQQRWTSSKESFDIRRCCFDVVAGVDGAYYGNRR